MQLSQTELNVTSEIGNGNEGISEIAKTLKLSNSQIYRAIQNLRKKGILENKTKPSAKTHVNMLLKLLAKAKNLSIPLSGTGIKLFAALIEPKTVAQTEKETGLHKTTILKKIKQGRRMSLLIVEKNTYKINDKIWPDVKDFFVELSKYEESIDTRVPITSIIYYTNEKEIIFSNKNELNATLTGFSAFKDFGIKIYTTKKYYYLPNTKLTKKEVFLHTLKITEKEMEIQSIILLSLFYLKFKKELNIKHSIIDNLKKVFKGENIKGYPNYQEIKDKAEVYGIEV